MNGRVGEGRGRKAVICGFRLMTGRGKGEKRKREMFIMTRVIDMSKSMTSLLPPFPLPEGVMGGVFFVNLREEI